MTPAVAAHPSEAGGPPRTFAGAATRSRPRPTHSVKRTLLIVILALGASTTAGAQNEFVAPTIRTVLASSEAGYGPEQSHTLYVTNTSTVPIVVFGIVLSNCENVKQSCGGRPTNITIGAGTRRDVYRVQPRDTEKGFEYRWSFSFRADSSDAKVRAVLREHGITASGAPLPREEARPTAAAEPGAGTPPPLDTTPRVVRGYGADVGELEDQRRNAPVSLRFKVGYGSILGSTMMPGKPVQATGPCVDPTALQKYERDAAITPTPWRPSAIPGGMMAVSIAEALTDSASTGDLLVRFVADTTGLVIPESVSVLESSSGKLSVRACQTVMGTRLTPARDKAGRTIRSWVQMPLRVRRY